MVRIERLVTLLLGIALLQAWWKLYRGKVKRWWQRVKDHLPRHWQPKSPEDCPLCRVETQTIKQVVQLEKPVTYSESKSVRGRKKQLDTTGLACPNEVCVYFGERDASLWRSSNVSDPNSPLKSDGCMRRPIQSSICHSGIFLI